MTGRELAAAALVCFALFFFATFLRHDSSISLVDAFDRSPTELALNLSDPPGWPVGAPLVLAAGQSGHLVYDVSLPPDAQASTEIVCADIASLEARLRIMWSVEGEQGESVHALRPGRNSIEFTPHIPPTGLVRLAIEARMPLGVAPQRAFHRIEVFFAVERTLRWSAIAFLFAGGALVWIGIPALLASELRDASLPRLRVIPTVTVLGIAGAAMLVPHRTTGEGRWEPLLAGRKYFDDSRAISNAALLIWNGGDVTQLYFRSFERPGYLVHTVPLCLAFPQQFHRASHAPSDFHARLWREFDRADATFTTQRQIEISIVAWGEAALCALVWALVWRRLGAGPHASLLAGLLGLLVFVHALSQRGQVNAPLTLTWNLLVNGVAVIAGLRLLDAPSAVRAFAAGAMVALAALTKTTAVTTALPLAVLWLGRVRTAAPPGRRALWLWPAAAVATATAIVLWWFEGLMGGLVETLRQHPGDFARIMEQHPEYPRRTPLNALLALWGLAGPVWLIALPGLVLGARRPSLRCPSPAAGPWHVSREAQFFAVLWTLSGLLAFVMPFLFPRFFKYMAPGLGLLAASVIAALMRRRR